MLAEFTYKILNVFPYGLVAALLIGLFAVLYFTMSLGLSVFFSLTLKQGWTEKVVEYPLFKHQIRHEILYSLSSIVIFGLYGMLIVICYRNHWVDINFEYTYWILIDLLILALWNEVHFYSAHKLMHTKWLMGIHRTHHTSIQVTPFSTYSFHPIESLIFGTVMILPMFVWDFELLALIIFPIYHLFFNTLGHSNVRLIKRHAGIQGMEISTQHNKHHTTHHSNFGFVSPVMDWLMGTWHKKRSNSN